MNNDYIIVVDENGEPFIAHAFENHKYFQKIRDGFITRYFYTREQLEAYLRRLRGQKLMRRQKRHPVENWQSNRPTAHRKTITGPAVAGWSKRRNYER